MSVQDRIRQQVTRLVDDDAFLPRSTIRTGFWKFPENMEVWVFSWLDYISMTGWHTF